MLDSITESDRLEEFGIPQKEVWEEQTRKMLNRSQAASAVYVRNFLGRVEYAKQFFAKEGLLLEADFAGHATNSLSRKSAAAKIEAAARGYAHKCGIEADYY
jgi:hypothetical protein